MHVVLYIALKQAVQWELIAGNPIESIDSPTVPRKRMDVWGLDETRQFLASVREHASYALYHLAINTGMRQGELLALQWDAIDFKSRAIAVQHSLDRAHGKYVRNAPKTGAGRRRVDLDDQSISALRAHQQELMARGLRASPWVFPNLKGGPRSGTALTHEFHRLTKAAGLRQIRFHDLRHIAATRMMELDVPAKVVQERLGHASVAITLNVYQHVTSTMQRDAADRLGALLSG